MSSRIFFFGSVACLVASLALPGHAQTTPGSNSPASPPAAATPAQPPATVAEPPKPTQEELNAPSGDASNARELTLQARPSLTVSGTATWDDGYTVLLNAFKGLRAEAKRLGLATAGPPQVAFTHTDDAGFRFDALVVLDKDPDATLAPQKNIRISKTPAGRAFVFQHTGAYDDIDSTYEAITAWLDEKGLTAKGAFVEEYLNEPEGSDDALLKLNIYVFVD